jgi:hypothetical protein
MVSGPRFIPRIPEYEGVLTTPQLPGGGLREITKEPVKIAGLRIES